MLARIRSECAVWWVVSGDLTTITIDLAVWTAPKLTTGIEITSNILIRLICPAASTSKHHKLIDINKDSVHQYPWQEPIQRGRFGAGLLTSGISEISFAGASTLAI